MSQGIYGPKRAEADGGIEMIGKDAAHDGDHLLAEIAAQRSFVYQASGRPDEPFVSMSVELDQLLVAQTRQVHLHGLVGGLPLHPVNPPVAPVPTLGVRIVAMLLIVPVDEIHRAVGTVLQIHSYIFRVGAKEQVAASMDRIKARAKRPVDLMIDLVPAEIVCEEMAAIFSRPIVAEINHGAGVRMPAVNRVAPARSRAAGAVIVTCRRQQVIAEVRKFFWRSSDDEWRVVRVYLVPKLSALNYVRRRATSPVAAAMRDEKLAMLVVIESPRIASTVREDFKFAPHGMIAPDARAQFGAFVRRHAGFSDARGVEHALVPI